MSDILVVGAGQLGLMMASAGARFAVSVDRIDHVTGELLAGTSRLRSPMPEVDALSRYRGITAELEHLLGNPIVENLRSLPNWCNGDTMERLPARDQQKQLLDQLGVATSPWKLLRSREDIAPAQNRIGNELVVKSIRDGYDGKGQWLVGDKRADSIPDEAFGNIIAEQKIPFRRELSLVGARFADGDTVYYPLVENYHQSGMLRYTLAPATGIDALQPVAEEMLGNIMAHLDYVGVMAMECFDSDQGLLVNELAPRVHNSGHWTQIGADYSQFDLHLFALLARPAGKPRVAPCSMMLNLIGCEWNPQWQWLPGIQCWWYGKTWRENRKLGHINISGSSVEEVTSICQSLSPTLDDFHSEMLGHAIQRLAERRVG